MKKYLTYRWISEHLGIIVLVPTLIGGLWQILELLRIGTAYIRFFSISQVVPDGLMILLVILLVVLISRMLLRDVGLLKAPTNPDSSAVSILTDQVSSAASAESSEAANQHTTPPKTWYREYGELGVGIAVIVAFVIYMIPLYSDQDFHNYFPLGVLLLTVFNAGLGLAMIKSIITTIIRVHQIKVSLDNKVFMNILEVLFMIVSLAVFFGSIFFLIWFHRSFLLSEDMRNKENIRCLVTKSNPGAKSFDVMYFNDRYIFISVIDSAEKHKVEVLEFSAFFDKEACTAEHK